MALPPFYRMLGLALRDIDHDLRREPGEVASAACAGATGQPMASLHAVGLGQRARGHEPLQPPAVGMQLAPVLPAKSITTRPAVGSPR